MKRIVLELCADNYQRVTGLIDGRTVAIRERPWAISYDDLVAVIYETCPGWIAQNRLVDDGDTLDEGAAAMLAAHGGELAAVRTDETLLVLYDWVQERRGHRWTDLTEAEIPAVMWCLPEVSRGLITGRVSVMQQPEYRLRRWALRNKGTRVRDIPIGQWPPIVNGLVMDQEQEAPWHDARLTGAVIDVRLPRLQEQALIRHLLGQ